VLSADDLEIICLNLPFFVKTDFGNPTGGRLGLFTAIQNIGGICALFFCEYSNTIARTLYHHERLRANESGC
jgi:hypothetical protein